MKNQEAALDFYTKQVGFEKKTDVTPPEGYRWVTVGPEGEDTELALFQAGTKMIRVGGLLAGSLAANLRLL